ncbi:hypothetical protein Egran_01442 [Elaphomyces granulatus]|uniref:D-lactate dehydrogenase n=1 Tax=Elaphomyces granulatus TaxID=519963 RepID=A0A232M372_9EURO|nr:hypothetical protein Egran_01442 [Elaphomyces granulatus]
MKLAVFSAKAYDKLYFNDIQYASQYEILYHDFALSSETVSLAQGCLAICVFVNDILDTPVLESLASYGVRAILLRCAGFNNVDLPAAQRLGLFVANVPSYSPEAVAEFAVALIQTLNRKTHRAYNRVREGNFSLDGLLGHTLHGKTVGVLGVGRIGLALARILNGFGCKLLAHDPWAGEEFKKYGDFVDIDALLEQSDILSLHCPLTEGTHHIINETSLARMKEGAMLVNTSRGGLIDSKALIVALKSKHLGGVALDVYEGEHSLFYSDHSADIIDDDTLMRLLTFPNVLVCGHQAFFTQEALTEITEATFRNLEDFIARRPCKNSLVVGGEVEAGGGYQPIRL